MTIGFLLIAIGAALLAFGVRTSSRQRLSSGGRARAVGSSRERDDPLDDLLLLDITADGELDGNLGPGSD